MRYLLFINILVMVSILQGQVAINTNGNNPDASAILDIYSTESGLLIPRMDEAARNRINNPAEGLLVYVTDKKAFYYFDGNNWILASADNLGDHTAVQNLAMQGHWISNDGDNEGIFITSQGNIGIGIDNTLAKVYVLMDANAENIILERNEDGRRPTGFRFWRSRGSYNNKTALQNRDVLVSMAAFGYDGSNYVHAAKIYFAVDGNVSPGIVPAQIKFQTLSESGEWKPRMVIRANGNIGIHLKNPQRALHLNGVFRLEPMVSPPSNPSTGDMYMDDGTNNSGNPVLRVYDGSQWHNLW